MNQAASARLRARPGHLVRHSPTPARPLAGSAGLGCAVSLWQPPRAHGEQPRERVVGPLELFYDLAVVVLVAEAARHLTWRGLGEFAVVFTLVWIAWVIGRLHHELHGHDDARARSTFLVQILADRSQPRRITRIV
jgi:hypothetical protein